MRLPARSAAREKTIRSRKTTICDSSITRKKKDYGRKNQNKTRGTHNRGVVNHGIRRERLPRARFVEIGLGIHDGEGGKRRSHREGGKVTTRHDARRIMPICGHFKHTVKNPLLRWQTPAVRNKRKIQKKTRSRKYHISAASVHKKKNHVFFRSRNAPR